MRPCHACLMHPHLKRSSLQRATWPLHSAVAALSMFSVLADPQNPSYLFCRALSGLVYVLTH